MKKFVPILVSIVLVLGTMALADKPCGYSGIPRCHQHVCKCGGDFEKQLPDGQTNPKNKLHSTYVCDHGCGEKSCCACPKPKVTAKHDAAGHVTRAGLKPSCAACDLKKSEKKKRDIRQVKFHHHPSTKGASQ